MIPAERDGGASATRSVVGEASQPSAVRAAVDAAAVGRWEALQHLVEVLLEVDAIGAEADSRSALAAVAADPALVVRLDDNVRRAPAYGPYREPAMRRVARRFTDASSGPLATALASMHGDGRIRERAVAAILVRPGPEMMPFLVLRAGDWVTPVRERARAGLAMLLSEDPGAWIPAVLPTVLRLDERLRGGFAVNQVRAAMFALTAQVWRGLLGSGSPRERRFLFRTGLAQGWLPLPDLVVNALTDRDVVVRSVAAEAACREAVWTRRPDVLRRLARSTRREVRVVALTGLVRGGHDGEVAAYLDDDAPLVRAVARDAARRLGMDAREHYRHVVGIDDPALGAIAGLSEIGSAADAALLRPLLAHPSARVRAQAVRALRLLDAVVAAELAALVRDPSPAVVREVATALRPLAATLPPDLPWELLADTRVELRRAGYRLLHGRGTDVGLRAGLIAALDVDPRLAERGRADVTRLARDYERAAWRFTPRPELRVSGAEHADLSALAARAASTLGQETSEQLVEWLTAARPGG
ncbi:hypothetical protein [Micromonospora arborensis]|uniref:hypothetical protein n=1 Tax=Micromonospora arborensis TaxID=2116518 RepID=UPI001FC98C53|nr:hypothetical protein [Micromonospora arborensis]